MMAVESPFIPPLERATIIPLFLKKKVFRYKPTVLRPLCGGEIFLDLMLEGLVEVELPDELSNSMEMEWPDVVCFFCFNFILFKTCAGQSGGAGTSPSDFAQGSSVVHCGCYDAAARRRC